MGTAKQMTFEEYLEFEKTSEVRHEFVDGFVFAMAGGTDNHNSIALNIAAAIRPKVRATPCRVFSSDVKLLTPSGYGYYPDVFVTCQEPNDGSLVKRLPCFISEVLSKTTSDIDRGEKWENYRKLQTLEAYILISPQKKQIEVYRRQQNEKWQYTVVEEEGTLELPCINVPLSLAEVYEDIEFNTQES
jgi:Uma2 family endonuclease